MPTANHYSGKIVEFLEIRESINDRQPFFLAVYHQLKTFFQLIKKRP